MVFRVFAAALAAGLLAAVLITGLQAVTTTPMILEAETFEASARDSGANAVEQDTEDAVEQDSEEAWMPQAGLERLLFTLLANIGAGVGFSLLLIVGLTFDPGPANAGRGVSWGVAGFAVFTLSPALGLPPELPGMLAADLQARQLWWLATVVFAAAGLGLAVFGKSTVIKAAGLVLLVLPHLWGAPHGVGVSRVPAELAARYSAATIALSAVFWVMIGYFSGLVFARLGAKKQDV